MENFVLLSTAPLTQTNHAVEGTVGEEHEESFPLTLEIAGQQGFSQGFVGGERFGSAALFLKFKNHGLAIQAVRRVYAFGSMDFAEEDFVRDRKGFGKGVLKDICYGRVAARFEAGD
jgi:hypothetical protein